MLPPPPWLNCNIDGATRGCPRMVGSGSIFLNNNAIFLGAFAINIGFHSVFHTKVLVIIIAIENAQEKHWHSLRLEFNFSLLVRAFSNPKSVCWPLFNRWTNCINLTRSFRFKITYIYREANTCADKFASFGV